MPKLLLADITDQAQQLLGGWVKVAPDGQKCRLTDRFGNFVSFDLSAADLSLPMPQFVATVLGPAVAQLKKESAP